MTGRRLIRLLQINLALSKQTKSNAKIQTALCFRSLQLAILITSYIGLAKQQQEQQ